MSCQVVAAAERAAARRTAERLQARVDPKMPRQFVTAREPTLAARRRARERTLVHRHRRPTAAPRRRSCRQTPAPGTDNACRTDLDRRPHRRDQVHRFHFDARKLVIDVGLGGRHGCGRLIQLFRRPEYLYCRESQVDVAQLDRRCRRRRRRYRSRPDAVGAGLEDRHRRRGALGDGGRRRVSFGCQVSLVGVVVLRLNRGDRRRRSGRRVARQRRLHLPVEDRRQQLGRHVLRRQRSQRGHRARRVGSGGAAPCTRSRKQPRRGGRVRRLQSVDHVARRRRRVGHRSTTARVHLPRRRCPRLRRHRRTCT